ncbi:carbohydrate ABC transporter membrane protein 1, CUT1 family [Halobiforma haloterrestris]|uniref:Carbohydrate ABC transporter membrane protein 1, CUT1 family n=1 Tax=Natronobacterium haloterrestre TaxID=148448 RepID=A0A1I1DBE8_NATHA|nr:sugar ABC transporter permease [Halobiforma haloterrestris]SFB72285.1 carbohydrate ABC transporter membrane protein 1, CUT1 family [Halobiforma haloterrestris]
MTTEPPAAERSLWARLRRTVGDGTVADFVDRGVSHPLFWLLPALLFIGVFQLYPMVEVFRMSLTDTSLISSQESYVWLENYRRLLGSERFYSTLRVTAIYSVGSIVLQLGLGLGLALAIDYGVRRGLRGPLLTRVVVLSAWVVPGIIIGLVWRIMLLETDVGVVNNALGRLGFEVVPFLSDAGMAVVSVIAAGAWRGTAFSMIMFYAGLKRVPEDLYRAAKVDGAGPVARFRYVTLPQLKPVVFVVTILVTIYSLNSFDLIFALTNGGPGRATEVIALAMYKSAFESYQMGMAAATAVVLLVVTLTVTAVYFRVFDISEEI